MTTLLKTLVSWLRTVFQRLLSILETPLVYLFGRDIFISYARSDATAYAQQLAIDLRTRVPKFSIFLDQWASVSGTTLPLTLRLALRWSQLMVFVGTQNAIDSVFVRKELQVFFNRRGRFVPIDVDNKLDAAIRKDQFLSAICGPGSVDETSSNVSGGTPSDHVVNAHRECRELHSPGPAPAPRSCGYQHRRGGDRRHRFLRDLMHYYQCANRGENSAGTVTASNRPA